MSLLSTVSGETGDKKKRTRFLYKTGFREIGTCFRKFETGFREIGTVFRVIGTGFQETETIFRKFWN